MTTNRFSIRRLAVAGGFAVAIAAAPAIAAFAIPTAAPSFGASCAGGESSDVYTGDCTPDMVPNSPLPGSTGGVPEVDNIPCTGANSGQCIGLGEDQQSGPVVQPRTSVSSSP